MNFDWQTEEEREWEQPDPEPSEAAGRSGRRWLWIVLSLALVAAAVAVTWRQVNERVDEASAVVKEEVLSSHTLARRAAAAKDEELFVSILSGRNSRWTEAQKERLRNGLLFEDALRPLGFAPLSGPAPSIDVSLNPELSEAVVRTVQPFTVDAGEGLTATVHLTQTHVYRQGSQRWLLSPPKDAFWGSWQTVDGDRLTVVAPERDQALAERLARDIEAKLGEMCGEVVACPRGFHVRLRLEKDPASVNEARERARGLGSDEGLTLPAPTLLGLPADEAAYEALTRAYARQAVAAAITSLAEYECCDGLLFFRATLEMQLAELDLRSPPLESGEYRHLLDIPTSAQHLEELWDREELSRGEQPVALEIYSLLELLQRESSGSARTLHRLQDSFDSSFWDWLRDDHWGLVRTVFEDRWNKFIQDSIREGQAASAWPQDLSLLEQDLVAMCGNGPQHVYRYDLRTDQWSREVEVGFEYGFQRTLPGDDGYIVTGELLPDFGEDRFLTVLMRSGSEPVTLAGDGGPGPFLLPWGIVEPGSQRMVVWLFQNPSVAEFDPQVALLDADTCTAQGCSFEVLSGMPVWSPDGSRKVTVDVVEGFTVTYEVNGVPQETTFSAWPFWQDNETFGVVVAGTTGREQQVRVTNVRTGETSVLLTSEDILTAIPEDRRPATLRFAGLLRHPAAEDRIIAMVSSSRVDGEESFLLEIRRAGQQSGWMEVQPEVRLLEAFEGIVASNWFMTGYSLNDRWLNVEVQRGGMEEGQGHGLLIYDLQEERIVLDSPLQAADGVIGEAGDWSAGGAWFARILPQRIDLIAPGIAVDGQPARYAIFHDFRECTSIGWVNR